MQQTTIHKLTTHKIYDLEEKTLNFSKNVITFVKTLKWDTVNLELIPQCVRSTTSIGANYREANDALGRKDFLLRTKTSRKEAKETLYWLELIFHANQNCGQEIHLLIDEARQLIKIFSAIIDKTSKRD